MNSYNTIVLHRVVEGQSKSFIDITLQTLRHILKASMSIGQLVSIDQAIVSSEDASRSICLTFDDGFSSDYDLVLPELKRINAAATFFIVTDWLGTPGYLTEQQVRDLSDSGMQIGSHSKSHPNFLAMTLKERLDELRGSKLILENIIGKEISTFSFPFGFYDDECIEAVFSSGYSICCTSKHGVSSKLDCVVPRNSINAKTSMNRLDKILNANLTQQWFWYIEDIIKSNLKRWVPQLYVTLRNLLSNL